MIERPIAHSLVWKCSCVDDTMERGPMMWVSFVMDGNFDKLTNVLNYIYINNILIGFSTLYL